MTIYTHHLTYQAKEKMKYPTILVNDAMLRELGDCRCYKPLEVTHSLTEFMAQHRLSYAGKPYNLLVGDKVSLCFESDALGNPVSCYWFRDCCSSVSVYTELYMITDVPLVVAYTDQELADNQARSNQLLEDLRSHFANTD